jgi:hypothetical protein
VRPDDELTSLDGDQTRHGRELHRNDVRACRCRHVHRSATEFLEADDLAFGRRGTTAKQHQDEATAVVADFLDISDLAAHMRGEIKPPDMLVDEWLQKGVLHWMQGEPEDGKSWVVLWCAVKLLQEDEDARVLIMDGEMGARAVGERLHALGLDPDTAEARVTHVNLSAVTEDHWQEFLIWAHAMSFTLVIWDASSRRSRSQRGQ